MKTNSSGTVEIIFNPRVIKDSTADYNITLKGVTGVTSVQLQKGTKVGRNIFTPICAVCYTCCWLSVTFYRQFQDM